MIQKGLALAAAAAFAVICMPVAAQDAPPPKPQPQQVSADFLFETKFVSVNGVRTAYYEVGEGRPVVFVHGTPTWSYTWRNVLPIVGGEHRAIAFDLLGMGNTERPDAAAYSYEEQAAHLAGFIDALGLDDPILVGTDWGGALAVDYTRRHQRKVAGVAFMEIMLPPMFPIESYDSAGPLGQMFKAFQSDPSGPQMVQEQNMFIEMLFPANVLRDLTAEEMKRYREPFPTEESRRVLLAWPRSVPVGGEPEASYDMMVAYHQWLRTSRTPKLHLYVEPSLMNPPAMVAQLAASSRNYDTAFVGESLHYPSEDEPFAIGYAINDWLRQLN